MPKLERKFYTVDEAAELLRISRQTVYRLIKAGEIKSTKIGLRRRVIPAEAIERLAKEGESNAS